MKSNSTKDKEVKKYICEPDLGEQTNELVSSEVEDPEKEKWNKIIAESEDQFGTIVYDVNHQIKHGSFSGILAAITDSKMCSS